MGKLLHRISVDWFVRLQHESIFHNIQLWNVPSEIGCHYVTSLTHYDATSTCMQRSLKRNENNFMEHLFSVNTICYSCKSESIKS